MPDRALILPPLRRTAADAAKFASIVHARQTDKAGRPYVEHLARVAAGVLRLSEGCPFWDKQERDEAAQIAWLHDTIKDKKTTSDGLQLEGFCAKVREGAQNLDGQEFAVYAAFISWLCFFGDLQTILVKLADVTDNSDPDRLALLPQADRERLTRKYAGAKEALQAGARAKGWRG